MGTSVSYALTQQPINRNLVPVTDRYYIDRLSNLSEMAMGKSIKLHEEAQQLVFTMLEDVERVIEKSPASTMLQKEWLLEACIRNYLLEMMHVVELTNRDMAYILLQAGSELNNEAAIRKLYGFFKWYAHQ